MTQPSLLDVPVPKKHRNVRDTSVAQYAVGREQFEGRKADVLRWLAAFWNHFQFSPTSAELASYAVEDQGVYDDTAMNAFSEVVLFTRRGISDLQTKGLVESAGKRRCAVTGTTCHVWRVVLVGR